MIEFPVLNFSGLTGCISTIPVIIYSRLVRLSSQRLCTAGLGFAMKEKLFSNVI